MYCKKIIKIIVSVFLLQAMAGCMDDDIYTPILPEVPDGKVRLTLYTNTEDYASPVTRTAADEDTIHEPMVLVFDGQTATAGFTEAVQSETSAGKTIVTLTKTGSPATILLIANAPQGKFCNGAATLNIDFTPQKITEAMTGKTLADVEDVLRTVPHASPQTTPPFTSPRTTLPASGMKQVAKIDEDTKIGESDNKLMLTRAVAKASVSAGDALTGFVLLGAATINAPLNGSLYRHTPALQDNTGNTTHYLTALPPADGVSNMAPAVANTTSGTPLYIYEARANAGTALIIKANYEGTDYYYKLSFYHNGAYLPVERNKNYKFTITTAGKGYTGIQDAINAPESNIHYEIEVTDAYAHELISNEHYYLGLSNSEVLIYGTATHIEDAFTITTDAGKYGITTGTIQYSGGLTGTVTSFTLSSSAEAIVPVDAVLTGDDGMATITVGSLLLTVVFKRTGLLPYSGYSELPGEYVSCEITAGKEWLKVSTDGENTLTTPVTFTQPGSLYILADINMGKGTAVVRDGGRMTVASGNTTQTVKRIKILVSQDALNFEEEISSRFSVPEYSYVGAFWRAGQTGERLIRIPYTSGVEGTWVATVVDGEDWIVMDTKKTEDTGVTWNENTEKPADMNFNDHLYNLTGSTATRVSGTMGTTENDYIYFRIGLTSTHNPTEEEPARYGMILLTYNDGKKFAPIYIRQGHAPDYLMRPQDRSPNGTLASRPYAKRFSPYNLTSEEYIYGFKTGGTNLEDHSQIGGSDIYPDNERSYAAFTEYPSQAGAYFQWANTATTHIRIAWHPVHHGSPMPWNNTNDSSKHWDELKDMHETCPVGYRRPGDGSTSAAEFGTLSISEVRQSLWYNALEQASVISTGNADNLIFGYYADGFFDRYEIVTGRGTMAEAWQYKYSTVSVNDSRIAYAGGLAFNPINNASLFFPGTNYRHQTTGLLTMPGGGGQYLTASRQEYRPWVVNVGKNTYPALYFTTVTGGVEGTGYSIRCVVDE